MTERVRVEIVADEGPVSSGTGRFLSLRTYRLKNHYPDGTASRVYPYEVVLRPAADAVAVALYTAGGEVLLREALRPPVALVEPLRAAMWELPAGLVEKGESALACAVRETAEETGFALATPDLAPLGAPAYATPGIVAERVIFYAARVDPSRRGEPRPDGSAVEERTNLVWLPIAEALARCRTGDICDLKTEVGLRRLAERLDADGRP